MSSEPNNFATQFDRYRQDIRSAQNERERAQYFIELLRRIPELGEDVGDKVGYPTDIRPELEEHLSTQRPQRNRTLDEFGVESGGPEGMESETVFVDVSGRLDARVGNLVIEFKDNLDTDLQEAKEQLRTYIYLLHEEGIKEDFLCLATDGEVFITYETLLSESIETENDISLSELTRLHTETADISQVKRWIETLFTERVHPVVEQLDDVFGVQSDTFEQCLDILERAYNESDVASVHQDEWADYLAYAQGSSPEEGLELYLRHTYLASFAKLLSYMVFTRGSMPSIEDAKEVLSGQISDPFPENLFEQDLFSWVGRTEEGDEFVEIMIDRLLQFNLGRVDQDVFKKLYQDMVSYEVRHDLGEYYTPDWLAEYMVREKLDLDPSDSVLDPGCGSGTFLVEVIEYKRKQSGKPVDELVVSIPEEVVGIDVHPLAVGVAKANYVAAIRDLLPYRRKQVQIPVFLADSVLFDEELDKTDEPEETDLEGTIVRGPIEISEEQYYLPQAAIDQPEKLDEALDLIQDYIEDGEGFERKLSQNIPEFAPLTSAFERIRANISRAAKDDRDSIHVFILKNFFRPLYLGDNGSFDALVGNPPWLSYRYMGDRQQHQVKKLVREYGLYPGTSVGQMELATLFICRCMDLYLHNEGHLAYVMPRAIFGAAQHEPFRRGKSKVKFDIELVLDLDEVSPLFNVPACALFAKKDFALDYPIPKETLSGDLPSKNLSWDNAKEVISIEKGEIDLNYGDITSWDDIPDLKRSDYFSKFHQGANLYPRQFVFVDLAEEASEFGFNAKEPPVRTSESIQKYAKEPYKGIYLEGSVESLFIYCSLLSRDIVPFTTRRYRPVVLPARKESSGYSLIDRDQASSGGYKGLADWLDQVNEHYVPRDGRETFIDQLDYTLGSRDGISGQNPDIRYRVLYPTSGTDLAGCVIDTQQISDVVGDLSPNGLIIDHKMHYYETNNLDEAYYLSSILNSGELNFSIKNLQSRGDFGERDIYRIPLEFPIPIYDPSLDKHKKLVELGKRGEKEAKPALKGAEEDYSATWKIREVVRDDLEDVILEIDNIVEDMLVVD